MEKTKIQTISDAIRQFFVKKAYNGNLRFTIYELEQYVLKMFAVSYDSVSRIMRRMKQNGIVNYDVVNPATAEYRVLAVSF
jgi:hypothetical protein